MNIEINVKGLESLVGALELLAKSISAVKSETCACTKVTPVVEEYKVEKPVEVEAPKPDLGTESKKPLKITDVRTKLAGLAKDGKDINGIFTKLGYSKLSEIPAELYTQVMEEADKL